MLKDSLLHIRTFDNYDFDEYRVINIAWPVEVYECAASKLISTDLNCLAEAVLKLIKLHLSDSKEIAKTLHMSPDLIEHIKHSLREENEFIDNCDCITEKGLIYFKDTVKQQFSEKKVFGHMVRNLFDGEIMPYFLEGPMPIIGGFPTDTIKFRLTEKDEDYAVDLLEKENAQFTEAYKKFCKIYDVSKEITPEDELDYLRTECVDVSYEDVDDDSQVITLADKTRKNEIRDAQVTVLSWNGYQIYILARLVIKRNNPEDMQLLSPFPKNITTWYNKKLTYFKEPDNQVEVYLPNGSTSLFTAYINDEIKEIVFEMPDLQLDDFNYYILANFPQLNEAPTLKKNIETILKEHFSCTQRFKTKGIGGAYVVSSGSLLIETLLNNFIAKIKNRKPIVSTDLFGDYRYKDFNQIDKLYAQFGISDCAAKRNTPRFLDEMSHPTKGWNEPRRVGNSITARYFFLMLEAFLIGKNPFKPLLKSEGQNLVDALDYMMSMRNANSAHNDKEYYTHVKFADVDQLIDKILYLTKLMIANLAEEEMQYA